MALDLPPLDTLRHILDRLKANDISWFKEQFAQGKFAWLKDRLPGGEYEEIESKVQAGDLGSLRGALGKIDLPGMDLFKGLGGAAAGAVGAVGAGAAGAAAMAGKGMSGIKGATTVVPGDGKKGKAWLWAVPIVAGVALLAFLLPRCGGSSEPVADDEVVDTSLVTEESVAVETTPIETTPVETTPAETTPVETTPAVPVETTPADTTPVAAGGDILSVADGAGNFKTLAAAVGAAGLSDTLKGDGPFTVFAPTDEAFAKLPAGAVDALLKPENKDALVKVLTYHVVSGKVMAADVTAGKVKSVEGSEFDVTIDGDKVKVNDANVISTDIAASNGVIHAIDTVLVPSSVDVAALLAGAAPSTEAPTTEPAAPAAAPEGLTVYFGNASSRIDAAAKEKIDGAIETLKALPAGTKVIIVGHASPTGNPERNKALSIERADNVKALLEAGLPDKNISFTVEARGDSQPDVDEAKSRKVTIEIQP